jgi:hypothetical protein
VKNTEAVPEGKSFFAEIKASVLIDKPSPITTGIVAKAGIVVHFGKRIDSFVGSHVAEFTSQI